MSLFVNGLTYQGADLYAGITYQSGPAAEGPGHRACELMDQGHSEADVIKNMTQENAGFTAGAATKFTQIAENVYCPQHNGGAVAPPPAAAEHRHAILSVAAASGGTVDKWL